MTRDTATEIQDLCRRIASESKPEKIILFGSHAYGRVSADSDIDLLVVMPFEGRDRQQAIEILNRVNVLLPVDLLVRISQQIEERLAIGDNFMREIVEKGNVMYEAHHI